jgi:hypothetical protein
MVNQRKHKMYLSSGKPCHIRGGMRHHPATQRITSHTITYRKPGEHSTHTTSRQLRNAAGNKLRKRKVNYDKTRYIGRNPQRRRVG